MNSPKFKVGDKVVHTCTGSRYKVIKIRKKCINGWDIRIAGKTGKVDWFNSDYYTLEEVYNSPLYQALKEEENV